MIGTFLAVGGPLDGHRVTSQYAGPDYTQYNCAYSSKKHKYYDKKTDTVKYSCMDSCILVHDSLVYHEEVKDRVKKAK